MVYNYRWVDLDGEGLSGILTETGQMDGSIEPNLGEGHFGPLQLLSEKPSFAALNSGRQQLLDLAGDGQDRACLNLVVLCPGSMSVPGQALGEVY